MNLWSRSEARRYLLLSAVGLRLTQDTISVGSFQFLFQLSLTLHLLLPISIYFLKMVPNYLPQSNHNKSKAV